MTLIEEAIAETERDIAEGNKLLAKIADEDHGEDAQEKMWFTLRQKSQQQRMCTICIGGVIESLITHIAMDSKPQS